jgi:hypothetical protein
MLGNTTKPPGSASLEKVAERPPTVSVNVVDVPGASLSKLNTVDALEGTQRHAEASAKVSSLSFVGITF